MLGSVVRELTKNLISQVLDRYINTENQMWFFSEKSFIFNVVKFLVAIFYISSSMLSLLAPNFVRFEKNQEWKCSF